MQFITTLAISAMCTVNPNARNLGALIYNDISISVEDRLASDVLLALEEDLGLLMKVYWETDRANQGYRNCKGRNERTNHTS